MMPEFIHDNGKTRYRVKRTKKEIRFLPEYRLATGQWAPSLFGSFVIPTEVAEGVLSILSTVPRSTKW